MIKVQRASGTYKLVPLDYIDNIQIIEVRYEKNPLGYILHTKVPYPSRRQVLDYLNQLLSRQIEGLVFIRCMGRNFIIIDALLKGVHREAAYYFASTLAAILKYFGLTVLPEDIRDTLDKYPTYFEVLMYNFENMPSFAVLTPIIQKGPESIAEEGLKIEAPYTPKVQPISSTSKQEEEEIEEETLIEEFEESKIEEKGEEEQEEVQVPQQAVQQTPQQQVPTLSLDTTSEKEIIKQSLEKVLGKEVVLGIKLSSTGSVEGVLSVPLQDMTTHVLIAAPTGWGKTAMLKTLLFTAALAGADVLIIDPKDYDLASGILPGKIVRQIRSKYKGLLYDFNRDLLPEEIVKVLDEKGLLEFEYEGRKIITEVYQVTMSRDSNVAGIPIVPSILGLAKIIFTIKKQLDNISDIDAAQAAASMIAPLLVPQTRGIQDVYQYYETALSQLILDYSLGKLKIEDEREFHKILQEYVKNVASELLSGSEAQKIVRKYQQKISIHIYNIIRSSVPIVPTQEDLQNLQRFMSFPDPNASYIKIIEPAVSFASMSSSDVLSQIQSLTLLLLPKLLLAGRRMVGRNKILLEVLDEYINLLNVLPQNVRISMFKDLELSLKLLRSYGVGIVLVVQRIRSEEIKVPEGSFYSIIGQFNIKVLGKPTEEIISVPRKVLGNLYYDLNVTLASKKFHWAVVHTGRRSGISYCKTIIPPLIPHASQTVIVNDIKKVLRKYYLEGNLPSQI